LHAGGDQDKRNRPERQRVKEPKCRNGHAIANVQSDRDSSPKLGKYPKKNCCGSLPDMAWASGCNFKLNFETLKAPPP
jgi:hypothetical protein